MSTPAKGGSIVIPAHNEAAVIDRCLEGLESFAIDSGIEVAVVCNGCTDDTADIARRRSWALVLELPSPSKTEALRLGDETVHAFPRLYLDADVILTASAARPVMDALRSGPALAARPRAKIDTAHSTWPVRQFYEARARLGHLDTALWGAGVYGLSAQGRLRFSTFPDVIADDLFVDRLYGPDEIIITKEPVTVMAPRSLSGLLAILRRTHRGNLQQAPTQDHAGYTTRDTLRSLLATGLRSPSAALSAMIYAGLVTGARVMLLRRDSVRWERDDSSRV